MNAATPARRAQFDHVSLTFDTPKGALKVVDDVTYDINDGDFIAVIGPSGCGKTTMMSMLAGFQKPTTGGVLRWQTRRRPRTRARCHLPGIRRLPVADGETKHRVRADLESQSRCGLRA
jgi:ABC-type oligopeptide transport system ATPase subunit